MNNLKYSFLHKNLMGSIIWMLLFISCQDNSQKQSFFEENMQRDTLNYSQGFHIFQMENQKVLSVDNPWQYAQNVSFQYVLDTHQVESPKIHIPVQKVVCLSTTHLAFINALGMGASVVGVTNSKLVSDIPMQQRIASGELTDIGNEQALNYETILDLNPDVIFAYSVGSEAQSVYQKFAEWKIPVVMVGEYLESSPLAKAEWIKFFGAFYNKEFIADSIFNQVVQAYNSYKNAVDTSISKPLVLTSLPWKDTWYVPGGNSFMATFIKHAGGKYIWSTDNSRESLALSIESVFYEAHEADIWIHTGMAESINDIKSADPRMMHLKPIVNHKVFNNNRRVNSNYGNDFWESGIINPHLILKDLINIFHPRILKDSTLMYYQHLQ
jgi:iron complex transport system substrate-binding protein